jgi:ribosomal protein L16 Arg81 hydroxylase
MLTRFERDYFSKKPLHLKARGLPDSGLETIDGLRLMLQGQPTRRQRRRLVVDLDPAAKRAEPLAPELKAMVDQGGPLIVNGVERVNPTVRRLADMVAAGLGGQAVVNGYFSPYKQDALDLHADNHEVVVLQLHGVKRWTIGTKIAKGLVHSSLFAIDNAAVSEHARRTDKFRSLELHPGDLLYLPRGLVHQATATEGGRYIFRSAFFVQPGWISPSLG